MAEIWFHNITTTTAVRNSFYLAGIPVVEHRMSKKDFEDKFVGNFTGIVGVIDGVTIVNPHTLQRYAGRCTKETPGLYPTDKFDALRVDNIMETAKDLQRRIHTGKLTTEDSLPILSALLSRKFAVGESLTIADCSISEFEDFLSAKSNSHQAKLVKYGNIVRSFEAVRASSLVKNGNKKNRGAEIEDC